MFLICAVGVHRTNKQPANKNVVRFLDRNGRPQAPAAVREMRMQGCFGQFELAPGSDEVNLVFCTAWPPSHHLPPPAPAPATPPRRAHHEATESEAEALRKENEALKAALEALRSVGEDIAAMNWKDGLHAGKNGLHCGTPVTPGRAGRVCPPP